MSIEILYFQEKEKNIQIDSSIVHSYHMHTHSYYEMTLYMPFDGEININDKTFNINSLTCTLIAPSDYHSIIVKNDCNSRYIKIGFTQDILDVDENINSLICQNIESNFIVSLFNEMLNNKDDLKYLALLIKVIVSNLEKSAIRFDRKINSSYKIVAQAIKIIDNNFSEIINEENIAKQLGVTSQYLSYLFKKVAKISFSKYLVKVRLKHAINLLVTTNDQITKICYDCGYNNLSHFLRSFKQEYGVSPLQYRNEKSSD